MALPVGKPDDKVKIVEGAIKKMGPKDLAALPDLDEGDFKVFGTLIQQFCFMDLNLRRALETFYTAGMLPKKYQKHYPNLPDSMLSEALAEIIKGMEGEDIETALVWIKVIDTTRKHRNLVAHFAARRYPNQDVYVLSSKSDRDCRRALGVGLGQHEVHTYVVGRPEFAEMTESAKSAQAWLAAKVPEWNERYLKPKPKAQSTGA